MTPCRTLGAALAAFVALAALLVPASPLAAQGVTTAAVSGCVTDEQGNPIENITVTVTNESTGFVSGALTNEDCRYLVPGLQIGGPYVIEASGLGYAAESERVARLSLGQRLIRDFTLEPEAVEVAGITAVMSPTAAQIINPSRTGQEQLVSENLIDNLPTIGRNFTDFIDISPLSGTGGGATAVANQNNRFNSIQIDGVVTQDLFGLGATGQPGGQAGARSISIDAVKEYQIIAAPFDVRQAGFTGGLINAVTKTGTNEWRGSAYGYFRSDKLVRDELEIDGDPIPFGDFDNRILGATVSGPIMEDRVHFFAAIENEGDERPGGEVAIGRDDPADTHVAVGDAQRFANQLQALGVDPGGFGPFTTENPNLNVFGRVDAQLNQNHLLTVRHNYVRAEDDVDQNRFGGSTYSLDSNFYFFETTTNSFVSALNSTFGQSGFNEATFGWTRIRDRRTPRTRYPTIDVRNVPDADESGTVTLRAGAETFSQANELDQDSWELKDNLSFDMGNHRITLGVQDQIFKFRNLFLANSTGGWVFNSLEDFDAGMPASYSRSVLVEGVEDPNARFTVNNVSLYGQTEYRGIENVVVTAGLRYDVPFMLDDPLRNQPVEQLGRNTSEMPSGNGVLSPRLGFNWNIGGMDVTQVRGGFGLFTGRQPFVWLSNLYTNTGLFAASIFCTGASLPTFTIDPDNQPRTCLAAGTPEPPRPVVNTVDPDFEFPSAWRFDAAVDHRLPWDIVGTAEFLYTKYRKQIFLRELNVDFDSPVSTTQGGRSVFGTHKPGLDTGGNEDVCSDGTHGSCPNRITDAFFHVIDLGNSDQDWAWNLIFQAQKRFSDGIEMTGSYTLSDAEDVSGLTSSIAASNIGFNPVGATTPNDPPASTSDYIQRHKITLAGAWDATNWLNWSLFYIGNTGDQYSYTYDGDVNADGYESFVSGIGGRNNDLVYVPENANDITLTDPADWDELDAFISTEECLNANRGRIIPRNVCKEPWRHRVDTRFTFKIPTISGQHGELVFDIFNVLNLLSEDWGRNEGVPFATIELLRLRGWDVANNRGIFELDTGVNLDGAGRADPLTTFDVSSRWQMQIGVRYEVD
jgi:hypothetical protein